MTEPRWLILARTHIGIKESPGSANNPVLMRWFAPMAKILGIAFNGDATPWCGAIMGYWMQQSGITPPKIAIRAKAWATWGTALSHAQLAPGAILVFARDGGGHVALYIGHDKDSYHVLGGNQGDAITIMKILKSRCIARRWPTGEHHQAKPIVVLAGAARQSGNES